MFFKSDAKRIFDVDILLSDTMDMAIRTWNQIYAGHPNWVDKDNHVKTICKVGIIRDGKTHMLGLVD